MASTTTTHDQANTQPAAAARRSGRPRWKGLLFRAAAVLLGLSPLLVGELALRGLGLGQPTDSNDPLVGFSEVHPLFVLDSQTGHYEIPKSRQLHFEPESFAAAKPAKEFRIFVLGGSTLQGRPWSIATSFTTWLELHLNAADRSRTYEVVNCGGVSYATYRLVPILREVLQYEPDLIVFCEGHNEFLEDRTYASIRSQPAALAWAGRQASRLRTYNILRDAVLSCTASPVSSDSRPVLGPEVDARLDWKDGLAKYHRDEKWQAEVIAHFDDSLRRIVRIADGAGVPLVLVSPVSNLEFAPLKSEHRAGITPDQIAKFDSLLEQARERYATDLRQALELLQRAAEIDDQHAQVHYEIGMCRLELGAPQEAYPALLKAKELDVCPLRMLEPMQAAMHAVATESGTPLVDAHALIAAHSRSGFPDSQWLVDHVHPTLSGHQLIADALAEKLAGLRLVQRSTDWEAARETAYQSHLATLSHAYFERGKQQLRSEQGWAHGRVKRVRDP